MVSVTTKLVVATALLATCVTVSAEMHTPDELRSIFNKPIDFTQGTVPHVNNQFKRHLKLMQANGEVVIDEDADLEEEEEEQEPEMKRVSKCPIKLDENIRQTGFLLFYGYIQGMYASEDYPIEEGCSRCMNFALPFANLMGVASDLIATFGNLSGDATASSTGTEQLMVLIDSFLIFWEFGVNFEYILADDTTGVMWKQFLSTFEFSYYGEMRRGLLGNLYGIVFLLLNSGFLMKDNTAVMPGCKETGVIFGGIIRRIWGYHFVN